MVQKVDLGASWASFGEGLGQSWAFSGSSWALLGRFLGVGNRAFIKHWSKIGSKRPSGGFWEGFGWVLGRFGEGLGRVLGGF